MKHRFFKSLPVSGCFYWAIQQFAESCNVTTKENLKLLQNNKNVLEGVVKINLKSELLGLEINLKSELLGLDVLSTLRFHQFSLTEH